MPLTDVLIEGDAVKRSPSVLSGPGSMSAGSSETGVRVCCHGV